MNENDSSLQEVFLGEWTVAHGDNAASATGSATVTYLSNGTFVYQERGAARVVGELMRIVSVAGNIFGLRMNFMTSCKGSWSIVDGKLMETVESSNCQSTVGETQLHAILNASQKGIALDGPAGKLFLLPHGIQIVDDG